MRWWRSGRDRSRQDADMAAEMAFHVDMEAERLMREEGLDAAAARRTALLRFGGVEQYREAGRDVRRRGLASSASLDVKLGFRMLRKYPGIAVVGGLAFAFAIAVGAASFEFLTQLVDPALPLPSGDRLVGVAVRHELTGDTESRVAFDLEHWQGSVRTIEAPSAFRTQDRNLGAPGIARELVQLAEISPSGLALVGVPALHGRLLQAADAEPGAPDVAVLGHALWQRVFAGDTDVIGSTIQLGNVPHTVVGIMPPGFLFPVHHDLWTPLRLAANPLPLTGPALTVFGRLAPGASMQDARVELAGVSARLRRSHPGTHARLTAGVQPYAQSITGITGLSSLALRSANLFLVMLLTLVCANVALLMYARAATRESEIVVRGALGATPGRIVLLFFTEALALGSIALMLGLATAGFALRAWLSVSALEAGSRLPFWFHAGLSPVTVLYAVALTILGAAIAGAVPGIKVVRGVGAELRKTSAGGGGLQFGGVWTAVIVAQVAMTVAFPAMAFLVRREVLRNQAHELALPAERYLSARVELDGLDGSAAARAHYADRLAELERSLEADPAVAGVTFGTALPRTLHHQRYIEVEGLTARAADDSPPRAGVNAVDPDFFETFGTAAVAGRGFSAGDLEAGARAVVVNQAFVREQLQGRNAVGLRVRYAATREQAQSDWYEIVGVVPDLGTISGGYGDGALYHPVRPGSVGPMSIALEVRGNPGAFAQRLNAIAEGVDPGLRLHDVMTLDRAGATLWLEFDFLFKLLIVISGLALLLSLAGIYAVMAFTVARRTREIGVRLALGAHHRSIVAATLRRPLRQVSAGIAAGALLVALIASAALGGALSLVQAGIVALYAVLMLAVCLLACVVPTLRVLEVEPVRALSEN